MLKPRSLNCSMVALGFVLACGARGNNHGLVDETSTTEVDASGGKQSTSKGLNIPLGSGGEATGATRTSTSRTDTATGGTTGSSEGQGGVDSTDPSNPGSNGGSTDGIDTEDPPTTSIDTEDPPPEKPGDTEDPPVGDTGDPPVGDTGDPPPGDTGDPPPGETGDPPEGCIMTEIDKVNVIIFGDASPSGADVEGRMWVGGNADFSGYGVASSNDPDAAPTTCDEFGLVVGGNLSGKVNAGDGKVAVYGEVESGPNDVTACEVTTTERPVDFDAVEKKLKGYSLAFRDYATNGTAGVEYGALVLFGKDPDLNVFSITAEQLSGIGQIKISVPETSSMIVNVSGKDVLWGGMGFVMPDGGQACRAASSDWCHRIVWNLHEAETLELYGIGVQGSVMAPLATVSGAGGNVDGQLVAQELIGSIEYHPYFFSGCLLLPKP